MQCLLYADWKIGQKITQTMDFELKSKNGSQSTWHISCSFKVGENQYQMATYEWIGETHILNAPTFYSFIEDWNRQPNAKGHMFCRSADFFDASFKNDDKSF